MTRHLTIVEAIAIHDDLIARYGGMGGIRDIGLLEAALARPRSGYYDGLLDQAAALWESLAQNHPFIDGNKRLGFAATFTFLAINGQRITADADAAFDFIDGLYQSEDFSFASLRDWLAVNVDDM